MADEPNLVFYQLTRSHIQHEDELLHHRLTWLFAIQAFLFTAYGFALNPGWYSGAQPPPTFSMDINNIRIALAITGGLSSFVIWLGLMAALTALASFANEWERKPIDIRIQFPPIAGRRFLGLYGGLLPPLILPPIFGAAWVYLELMKTAFLYTGAVVLFLASLIAVLRFGIYLGRRNQ